MQFDMSSIYATRLRTEDDGPAWVSTEDPVGLSIRDILVDFHQMEEDEDCNVTMTLVARLEGLLVLGDVIDSAGEDFFEICDARAGDLGQIAYLAEKENILETHIGTSRNVLLIRQLDLAREIIDASNFPEFFDLIPPTTFILYNVHPELLCYLVAEQEGYYDQAAAAALLDPRSVDGYSPLLYSECGFTLDKSGEMLYRLLYDD